MTRLLSGVGAVSAVAAVGLGFGGAAKADSGTCHTGALDDVYTVEATTGDLPWFDTYIANLYGDVEYEKASNTSASTPRGIMSGSKWLISATVMQLVDRGWLDLNAPISTYLPADTVFYNGNVPGGGALDESTMTLAQLLSHTSGISAQTLPATSTLEEGARAGLQRTPASVAGKFVYGNADMQVAGWIVQLVDAAHSGSTHTWNELFQNYVGDPLGMTATSWSGLGEIGGTTATSTSHDYAKFLKAVLADDGTFLSHQAIATMLTPQVSWSRGANSAQPQSIGYALGSWVMDYDGDGVIDGYNSAGMIGAYVSWGFIDLVSQSYGQTIAKAISASGESSTSKVMQDLMVDVTKILREPCAPATTEPPTTEPATTEPATTEPATTEPPTTEPPTTEPATTEPATPSVTPIIEPSVTPTESPSPGSPQPSTTVSAAASAPSGFAPPSASSTGSLPGTGTNLLPAAVALLALVAGGVLLVVRRVRLDR